MTQMGRLHQHMLPPAIEVEDDTVWACACKAEFYKTYKFVERVPSWAPMSETQHLVEYSDGQVGRKSITHEIGLNNGQVADNREDVSDGEESNDQ